MPWVLNAAWKIIKAWLPASGVKLIKFLTKSNINEYIDESNTLEAWGGSDPWAYHNDFFSPPSTPIIKDAPFNPFDGPVQAVDDVAKKKSVTFAEIAPSPSEESLSSLASQSSISKPSDSILRLIPSDEVVFSPSPAGDLVSRVQVVSLSPRITAYKIKTTSPEKYRVRPSSGLLSPGSSATIELHVSASNAANASSLVRDKFLITAVYLDREDLTIQQINDVLKSSKPEGQYRLRCALGADHSPVTTSSAIKSTPSALITSPDSQHNALIQKINKIKHQNEQLANELRTSFRIQTFLLLMILCFLVFLIWHTTVASSSTVSSTTTYPFPSTLQTTKENQAKPEL